MFLTTEVGGQFLKLLYTAVGRLFLCKKLDELWEIFSSNFKRNVKVELDSFFQLETRKKNSTELVLKCYVRLLNETILLSF